MEGVYPGAQARLHDPPGLSVPPALKQGLPVFPGTTGSLKALYGQFWHFTVQDCDSSAAVHGVPPPDAWVHVRVCVPGPHVPEEAVHGPHEEGQLQFTGGVAFCDNKK